MGVLPILPLLLTIVPQIIAGRDDVKAVVEGNILFNQKLYKQLALAMKANANPNDNIFYSPVGAHAALSMTYQGAEGATHEAFSKVLGVEDHMIAATGYHDIMATLKASNVTLANAVFLRTGLKLNGAFLTTTKENYFHSHVDNLNFNDTATADTINKWVQDNTNNKIENTIETTDFKSDTLFVLINAIYFKGNWRNKFNLHDPEQTEKFYLNPAGSVEVQMMEKTHDFNYKEDDVLNAKVLEIPYVDEHLSLVIILPNKKGIAGLEKKLETYDLTKITDGMEMTYVAVTLPKLKISSTMTLNNILENMGLRIAFNSTSADFSLISGYGSIKIDRAVQTAFIEVDEKGVEAASATAILGVGEELPTPEEFKVDHPFMMFLLFKNDEQFTGHLPLFVGKIMNPEMDPDTDNESTPT